MSIRVTRHKGQDAPLFTCAVCNQVITDAALANLLWNADALTSDDDDTDALIAHKGRCTNTADRKHGTHLYCTELTVAIYQLMTNSRMDFDDLQRARATHQMLTAIGRSS